ncbi:hypothetical protein BDC45DRAFT_75878 [Circinella umbellata]|nr:hypothetical protein BDC45DRAFT_75878 [Circinella umbellata]
MPDQIKRKRPTKDGNNIAKKQQKRDPRGYPRKPPLNGLPGDYNLPQKLRVDLNVLNGFLTVPAKHWSNIQEVLKSYFSETTATLKNGNEFHNLLISTLNTIKEDKGPSVLGEYASRMHTYYNVHLIKEEVRQLYDAKLLIVNLDKEKQRAILAGQRTGAILSRKGAEELAKEIEQDVEQDNEEHQNNQDKQETSNNDVMRIVDGDYNPSVEEIESTMDEEEEEEEKRECIILDNGYPALATTKAIDIGPAPKDMPNDENSRLAKEFHKYKEAVVKQGLNNILTYESNTHEIL